MTTKIVILEPHSGEIGEAIRHEDHVFEAEEYHYESGQRLEVAIHDTGAEDFHIFTDLDTGHRFKIPPAKYRMMG